VKASSDEERGEFRAGWVALVGATAAVSTGGALYNYTASFFIKAIQGDFGWSRAEIATGSMIMSLTSALLLPGIGHLTDRYGPLRVGGLGLAGYGLMLLALSSIPGKLAFYYAVLFGLAMTFAASTAVTFAPLVAKRFIQRRGLAFGIMMSGPAILLIPVSPLLTALIAQAGWRTGYMALGLGALFIGIPGLLIASRGFGRVSPKTKVIAPGLGFRDVLRTRTYWKLIVGTLFSTIPLGGFLHQYAPLLTDKNFSTTEVGLLGSIFVSMVLIGRTTVGALLDVLHPSRVAMASLWSAAAGSLLMLAAHPSFVLAALFLGLIGAAFGAEGDVQAFFSARQFGLRCFSTVFGTLAMLNTAGVGIGALIFGWIYDTHGTYDIAIYIAAASLALGGVIFGSLPRSTPTFSAPPLGRGDDIKA
jgi:MFS family permease